MIIISVDMIQSNIFGVEESTKGEICREELSDMLFPIMSNMSLMEIVGMLTNHFNEIVQYAELRDGKSACQKMSLLFNPHRLDTKSSSSKKSIYEAMKTKSFVDGLARATLFKKGKVNELLYQVLQLGINGVQYINEFPPHVAAEICRKYGMTTNSSVLDPCAGWGGRMIGCSVVVNQYTCFEPSTKTYEGLINLFAFLKSIDSSFFAEINCIPFEDSNLCRESFDMAITSPPYYDTEIYTDESSNSLNRYNSFDRWCDGFYLPMVEKTMDALKSNSVFILNIGSRKYPLTDVLISSFGGKYSIKKTAISLSGIGGLGKSGEGESFYEIRKG